MEENLKYLSNFRETEFKESIFLKPKSILYDQRISKNCIIHFYVIKFKLECEKVRRQGAGT